MRKLWTETKILEELSKIAINIGQFPLQTQLNEMRLSGLTNAISANGGMNKYRKMLNYPIIRKESNYWRCWNNVEKAIKENFTELIDIGILPSRNQLRKAIPSLGRAIYYFGGMANISKLMKCECKFPILAPDGHYVNSRHELILDIFLCKNNIHHTVNGLIHSSRKFRYDFKVGETFIEIWGMKSDRYVSNKNNKINFYRNLDLNLIELDGVIFEQSLNKTFIELNYKLNNLFKIKRQCFLNKEDHKVCNSTGYWNYDNTLNAILDFIKETGEFPTYKKLVERKQSGLHAAIHKHGGLYFFRNLLNMRKKYQKV